MPPILLLKGDKEFYGKIKPESYGKGDPNKMDKGALPPNPVSAVHLATETQRQNQENRMNADINDPKVQEKPTLMADTDKSIGQRFTDFMTTDLVPVSAEDKKQQEKRQVERITGIEGETKNIVRPIGEVPGQIASNAIDFIKQQGLQILIVVGGIYLIGKYIEGGIGKSGKSKKSDEL